MTLNVHLFRRSEYRGGKGFCAMLGSTFCTWRAASGDKDLQERLLEDREKQEDPENAQHQNQGKASMVVSEMSYNSEEDGGLYINRFTPGAQGPDAGYLQIQVKGDANKVVNRGGLQSGSANANPFYNPDLLPHQQLYFPKRELPNLENTNPLHQTI